jgi:hypothetical protein
MLFKCLFGSREIDPYIDLDFNPIDPSNRPRGLLEMFNVNRSHQTGSALLSMVMNVIIFSSPVNAQPNPPAPAEQPSTPPPPELDRQKNYLGIGPAFGLGGSSTALSTGGLAIFSKNVLSDNLSIHNTNIIFGSSVPSSSVALTLDFPLRDDSGIITLSPFVGAGVQIRSENSSTYLAPHVTGGVDVPLPFGGVTGLVHLNVAFPSDRAADIGLLLGVGIGL